MQDAVDELATQNCLLDFCDESRIDSLHQSLEQLRLDSNKVTTTAKPDAITLNGWKARLAQVLSDRKEIKREEAILTSLDFESRPTRHSSIPDAYQRTFEWIFTGNFGDWMEHGSGAFWVTGKAGSGKSTLMKFVADHPQTQKALERWAAPLPYIIGAHYFWNPGTSLQKSHKGLLQTLLYHIYRQCPSAMSYSVHTRRWNPTHKNSTREMVEPWTIQELSKTFQSLAVQESLPVRLCLFVDGLDEFEGDMEELCEVLASLVRSSHVKLVISSRPWNVFENHFGQNTSKKLYMHELTEQDILRVATGRLESHPRWHDTVAMATTDSYNRRKHPCLVSRICERASGVFLWVWLVTQSLRNGLSNHDTMDDLESRLDALPVDLERLFEHMFEQIDPFYHQLGAESLLLVLHASKPLTLQMLYHHKIGRNHGLSYALDRSDETQIDEDQIRKAMLPGINAISGGLLEVHNSTTIGFLHGTVRDFLIMEKTRQLVAPKVCPDFDVYFSLSQAFVADHKLSTRENNTIHRKGSSNYGPASKVWINPPPHLDFISKIQPRSWDGGILLLDELEYDFTKLSLSQPRNQYLDKVFTFRDHLVSYDLSWYLEAKLAKSTASDYLEPFKIKGHSPLFTSLTTEQTFSIDVVKLLLQHGEDINLCSKYFQFSGYSP